MLEEERRLAVVVCFSFHRYNPIPGAFVPRGGTLSAVCSSRGEGVCGRTRGTVEVERRIR